MSDITNRRQMLEDKIGDLEQTLVSLKSQLKEESEREQHAAIDRLEEYLGDLDHKHAKLQDFWKVLREEIQERFSGATGPTGKSS